MKPVKLIAAIVVVLALVPVATAQAEGVDGGNLHLKLSHGLAKMLQREGVRLVGTKPATAGESGATLPISSGLLEQRFGSGYLFLEGDHAREAAAAAGDEGRLQPRPGSLPLTPKAAKRLNGKLGLGGVFKAARSLGSATAVAHFEWLAVTGGEIVFTIEEGFRKKLASVEAFVGASGSATLRNPVVGVVAIPLEGGQVAPDGSAGVLLSQGGLSFAQHDEPFDHTLAFLDTNLGLESRLVTGDTNYNPNPQQVPFSGPFATLGSTNLPGMGGDPETGVVSSPPIQTFLQPNFAKVLNEAFGAPKGKPELFTAGEAIGWFAYEAQTR